MAPLGTLGASRQDELIYIDPNVKGLPDEYSSPLKPQVAVMSARPDIISSEEIMKEFPSVFSECIKPMEGEKLLSMKQSLSDSKDSALRLPRQAEGRAGYAAR